MGVVSDLFANLDGAITGAGTDLVGKGTSVAAPYVKTFLVLYIMIWGIRMLYGAIDEPIKDFINRIILLTIWVGVFLGVGLNYNSIFEFFWSLPAGLINAFSGESDIPGVIENFDAQFNLIIEKAEIQAETTFLGIGVPDFKMILISFAFGLLSLILSVIALYHYALAKLWLAVLLGVGPIFLLFYIFETTKQYTSKWIAQTVYYVIYILLLSIVIGLIFTFIMGIVDNVVGLDGEDLTWRTVVSTAIGVTLGAIAMMSVPTVASALAGGVQMMGANTASRAMGAGGKGIKQSYKSWRNNAKNKQKI